MDTLELRCGGTQVHIDRFGAMFTAEFTVNGQRVNPLFRPAWHGNFMDDAFLNGLQGEMCIRDRQSNDPDAQHSARLLRR